MTGPADRADLDERAFRLLCETCGVGFWHIDPSGRTVYLNAAMGRLLELDAPTDIVGELHHRFFTAESLERMRDEHGKRSGGIASTYPAEVVGRKGGRRSVVVSGVPVTDATGRFTGMCAIFTDVTDVARAERALRESDDKLRSLFAASIDAIGVSRDGLHLMVNPAYVRMFGYVDERELVGTPILALIAPEEHPRVASYVRARFRGQSDVRHYLTRGVRRDGQTFPLEVHVSSYENDGGMNTVVILRDITARLQLEEQLRQTQKMDALGRLAGGVAHDFNNLLTVIMSCADLALTELPPGTPTTEHVQLIRSSGQRAATLTRQLLALSRRQVIDPKVLELDAVVGEMAAMLRRLIGSHIELAVDAAPSLPRVRVDVGQIQQVIMNLCVNARDAMSDGGRLTIRTRSVHLDERQARALLDVSAGPYVLLSVEDTGHGMSPEVQERLFEPFFTTKAPGAGTGLGLSTVYGIVKQSGGHVAVRSAAGAGSRFDVYLPAVEAPLAPGAVMVDAGAETGAGTVLLVDDEPALRQLMHRYLSAAGYRVLAAASGVEALELFDHEGGAVDLVVTDMLMPTMSGVELARELDRRAPGIQILFVSGYASEDAAIPVSRASSAFLAKPFTLPALAAKIQALLATR